MIGMTGISGELGISDIIIPRWYKSFPGPILKQDEPNNCFDVHVVEALKN